MRIRKIVTLALAFMLIISCLPVSALTTSEDFYSRYIRSRYAALDQSIAFQEGTVVINTQEELIQTRFTPEVISLHSDAFFQTHYLVIVSVWAHITTVRYHVDYIDENGKITILELIPWIGGHDIVPWHIVIELCRSFQPESFEAVFVETQPGDFPLFIDVSQRHWVRPYVLEAYQRDIIDPLFYFLPHEAATRAMAADLIWRAAGAPVPVGTASPFVDVATDDWFFEAVLWANENGIILGRPDGTFAPGDTLERRELATMLARFWRYLNFAIDPIPPAEWPYFEDHDDIGMWAEPYVRWNFSFGLLRGDDTRHVHPQRATERAEAVATVVRFADMFLD